MAVAEGGIVVVQCTGTVVRLVSHGGHIPIEGTVRHEGAVWVIRMVSRRLELHFSLLGLPLVLHTSVLKPSLHLHVRQPQSLGQLSPLSRGEVLLLLKLLLQFCHLLPRECCPDFLLPPESIIIIIITAHRLCTTTKNTSW